MDSFHDPDQLRPYFDRPCQFCSDTVLMQWMTDNRYTAMVGELHRRTRGLYKLHAHRDRHYVVDFPEENANGFYFVRSIRSRDSIAYAVASAIRVLKYPVLPCLTDS